MKCCICLGAQLFRFRHFRLKLRRIACRFGGLRGSARHHGADNHLANAGHVVLRMENLQRHFGPVGMHRFSQLLK